MTEHAKRSILRVVKGRPQAIERLLVEEYPLRLRINGRDLATLVCSPHQLNFLLAGFCLLQGFIDGLDDILSMGTCSDYGLAELRLRREVPSHLRPTLTSGCGTGIVYDLPAKLLEDGRRRMRRFAMPQVIALMQALHLAAEHYRSHGGIHSAAVGDASGLLLYAEDLGRHNTLDRLAGEMLFRGLDLHDSMLVTSGRVSTEMVAKAVRLGIGLIASRTSPTDLAVDLCQQAGITLVGYLRGDSMEIYTHADHLQM